MTHVQAHRALPITMRGLTKRYGDFVALDSVDLDIKAGEFLTLLGPSGSGKTTLLMMLAGFTRPTAGSIQIAGDEVVRVPPHKRDLGMVFQNYALFPHMTVHNNVAYPLKLRKVPAAERRERVERALDLVKLGHLADRQIDQLSGGQKQRIALARAIVFEPRILLMDEPLSALDKKLREHMQIEIRRMHEQLGITTIYVTHDQREALTMSDRIAVINHGRIAQLDAPRCLYERPADSFVADFIGESTLVPVETAHDAPRVEGKPLRLGHDWSADRAQGNHYLLLRPEKLELLREADAPDFNTLPATVDAVVYQGDSMLVELRLDDGTEVALRRTSRREVLVNLPQPGERLFLGLHPEDTVIVPEAA
jgi:putative spermidine/putrescine transport system ATP-binding protein